MKINSAKIFKSVFVINDLPKMELPEFVFVGRSNVGKSSLINTLCNVEKLAKTSSTPGKTQSINYFLINDKIFFVDLPGYGFAKISKDNQSKWKNLIEVYLKGNINIKLVFVLVDIRHGLLESDKTMIDWLTYNKLSFAIILMKADKVSRNEMMKTRNQVQRSLNENLFLQHIIPFSIKSKTGLSEILNIFEL